MCDCIFFSEKDVLCSWYSPCLKKDEIFKECQLQDNTDHIYLNMVFGFFFMIMKIIVNIHILKTHILSILHHPNIISCKKAWDILIVEKKDTMIYHYYYIKTCIIL